MRLIRARVPSAGVAGVVVTHDAQLASWADRVVFLRDGRVVDQTAPPAGPGVAARAGAAAVTVAARPARRRRRSGHGGGAGAPRRRPLGVADVPPRVAPAGCWWWRSSWWRSRRRSSAIAIASQRRLAVDARPSALRLGPLLLLTSPASDAARRPRRRDPAPSDRGSPGSVATVDLRSEPADAGPPRALVSPRPGPLADRPRPGRADPWRVRRCCRSASAAPWRVSGAPARRRHRREPRQPARRVRARRARSGRLAGEHHDRGPRADEVPPIARSAEWRGRRLERRDGGRGSGGGRARAGHVGPAVRGVGRSRRVRGDGATSPTRPRDAGRHGRLGPAPPIGRPRERRARSEWSARQSERRSGSPRGSRSHRTSSD